MIQQAETRRDNLIYALDETRSAVGAARASDIIAASARTRMMAAK